MFQPVALSVLLARLYPPRRTHGAVHQGRAVRAWPEAAAGGAERQVQADEHVEEEIGDEHFEFPVILGFSKIIKICRSHRDVTLDAANGGLPTPWGAFRLHTPTQSPASPLGMGS